MMMMVMMMVMMMMRYRAAVNSLTTKRLQLQQAVEGLLTKLKVCQLPPSSSVLKARNWIQRLVLLISKEGLEPCEEIWEFAEKQR